MIVLFDRPRVSLSRLSGGVGEAGMDGVAGLGCGHESVRLRKPAGTVSLVYLRFSKRWGCDGINNELRIKI